MMDRVFSDRFGPVARVSAVMTFWFAERDNDALLEVYNDVVSELAPRFEICSINNREGEATKRRLNTFRKWCTDDRAVSSNGLECTLRDQDSTVAFRAQLAFEFIGRAKKRTPVGYLTIALPPHELAEAPDRFEQRFRELCCRLPITQAQGGYAVLSDLQDRGGIGDELCDEVEALLTAHPRLGLAAPYDFLVGDAVFSRRQVGPAWLVAVNNKLAGKDPVDGERLSDQLWLFRAGPHQPWNAPLTDEQRALWSKHAMTLKKKRVRRRDIGGGPSTAGMVLCDGAPFERWLARFDVDDETA